MKNKQLRSSTYASGATSPLPSLLDISLVFDIVVLIFYSHQTLYLMCCRVSKHTITSSVIKGVYSVSSKDPRALGRIQLLLLRRFQHGKNTFLDFPFASFMSVVYLQCWACFLSTAICNEIPSGIQPGCLIFSLRTQERASSVRQWVE